MPKKTYKIVVVPGDGIGPEVVAEGVKVLRALEQRFGHRFDMQEHTIGGAAIDAFGTPLQPETLAAAKRADAVLLGAVGGPKWDDPKAEVRPEQAVLALRKKLGLYANLRPVKTLPALVDNSTFKPDVIRGVDLMFVRELTGGTYFAKPKKIWETATGLRAVDTTFYTEQEIERAVRTAFELARGRRKKVTSVDKANVMATSRLWRIVAERVAGDYPDVEFHHMLADACAMHLTRRPTDFDVIVADNLFGDLLTDLAAMLGGSLGMLPSASLGAGKSSLFEPIHGSAPDIAGKGLANPLATILSVAMLLRYGLHLEVEARAVEAAVARALAEGLRTPDTARTGEKVLLCSEMGDWIATSIAEARSEIAVAV
ncbi:MAG: 3-isopropylmalate dehydrogenase [Chloroflexi bacterium]|nr:3-isopropylmalate dehydrogenase [Chloroflexota bacterium]